MKSISLFVCAMVLTSSSVFANCPTCEKVREYNKNHPENNYEYFEEYAFEHPEEAPKPIQDEAKKETPAK